ncbi:hypothetical protein LAZ67_7000808 [Cordylochernes scorpioides]|uniref:Retroviral polymerase SH3-like domain-containing protein n=1 Tax=Cordylochernes scorpioides TaxID=51811 RepID=A0ABY6KLS3_9ARAC|nr:hypothetical protein LAZ67_7000808 [Cordylochernes scorpioides]
MQAQCLLKQRERRSKPQPRALGYALGGHGWRIWIHEKNQVIESRDCVFQTFNRNRGRQSLKQEQRPPNVSTRTFKTLEVAHSSFLVSKWSRRPEHSGDRS